MPSPIEIDELHFIDDSSDEIMITRMILKKDAVAASLQSYFRFDEFQDYLKDRSKRDFSSWIVAIDLNLGVSSGIDAIRSIRQERNYDRLIAGICTGSDDPKDRRDSLEAGADFFVTKPLRGVALEKICGAVSELSLHTDDNQAVRIMRAAS